MEYFDYLPELTPDRRKELFRDCSDPDHRPEALKKLAGYRLSIIDNIALGKEIEKTPDKEKAFPKHRKVRMGVTGGYTFSHLNYNLIAAAFRRGILLTVEFSPFDSVYPIALGEIEPFHEKLDYILIHNNAERFYNARMPISDIKNELLDVLNKIRDRYGASILYANFHARHYDSTSSINALNDQGFDSFVSKYNAMCTEIAASNDVILLDVHKLSSMIGVQKWLKPTDFYRSKTPFGFDNSDIFSDYLARLLGAVLGIRKKIAVLDMDGVLWGGVLGDNKANPIIIGKGTAEGEAYTEFQNYLVNELYKTGIILAAASKNDIGNVEEILQNNPEMVLRRQHFAMLQVNWQDKVSNIKAIAEALNCGLDSIVFIDDNICERTLVREKLPEVSTLEIGGNPAYYPSLIANSGYFDYYQLSSEDLKRTQSYINNLKRIEIKKNFSDYGSYLKSLDMKLNIAPFEKQSITRIAQLISRTNQFNLLGDKLTNQEIEMLSNQDDKICIQVSLEDKLESYGIISVLIATMDKQCLSIDTWVMSCRVFNRDIENAIMNFLYLLAKSKGLVKILGRYKGIKENNYVYNLYAKRGFTFVSREEELEVYEITTDHYKHCECSISNINRNSFQFE